MTRADAATDVLLALLLTLFAGVVAGVVGQLAGPALPLLLVVAVQGVVVLAGLAVLVAWRGERWRALGFRRFEWVDLLRGAGALVLVIATGIVLDLMLRMLAPAAMETHGRRLIGFALALADVPIGLLLLGMLFVGFYEELLARGLLLTRCRQVFGGIWAPVLASSLLFGLGHAYQGWTGMVQTTLVGIVLARLALYWGRLWPVIIAHATLNGWSLIMVRLLSPS